MGTRGSDPPAPNLLAWDWKPPGLLLQSGPRARFSSLPKGTATRPPRYHCSLKLVLTALEEVADKGGGGSSRSCLGQSREFNHFLPGLPLPLQTSENHPGRGKFPPSPRGSRICALALAFLLGHLWNSPSAPVGRRQDSPVLEESISAFPIEAKGVWTKERDRGQGRQPAQN